MKKLIAWILALCTLLALTACAPAVDPEAELAAEKQGLCRLPGRPGG